MQYVPSCYRRLREVGTARDLCAHELVVLVILRAFTWSSLGSVTSGPTCDIWREDINDTIYVGLGQASDVQSTARYCRPRTGITSKRARLGIPAARAATCHAEVTMRNVQR